MRINCHAHVFNAKSVFTSETLDILLRRLTEMKIPALLKNEIVEQLQKILKKAGDYVDEETLFRNVVKKVSTSKEFKDVLKTLATNDTLKLELAGGAALQDYAVDGLIRLLEKVGDALNRDDKDAAKGDIGDALAFLRIALQPSIRHVTDILMEQLTLQDAVIPLMMDITHDGGDEKLLEKQLADTSAQILAYPGRIFPFVAVNTKRPEYFSIMESALAGRGFVGVKLYPSLGYAVNSPEMFKVYAYCEERGVPILMHCSEGGFYASDETRNNSDPTLWTAILQKHPSLKICFGHFGGAQYLAAADIPTNCWTRTILDLMVKFKGVYADIAYHSEPMDGGSGEKNYFKNLSQLLQNPDYSERILFGTDYFLSRQRLTEKSYWKYFSKHLSENELRQMTEDNPLRYLGLPDETQKMSIPIANCRFSSSRPTCFSRIITSYFSNVDGRKDFSFRPF
ncbi:amidohydrolase [Desulfobulbus rhabdoformis]|uniref:amidohydrolase family protein n=1 Tax=Desulfobulbus rhabdoformis TaxID=34032 RepID=UPI0019655084|nr:amidohydrolase family protein [Desulfobulbus rhabdoformis]MBM9616992.1 amidohydrolase [Desulfobulbus rhabdoformis]